MTKNISQEINKNPLLKKWETRHQTPPFNKIKTRHFLPAIKTAITEAKKEVEKIISNTEEPDFKNTVVALEMSGNKLSDIRGVFFNLLSADTSNDLQDSAQKIMPLLTEYGNFISLNEKLFEKIKTVYQNNDIYKLSAEDHRLLEITYKSFVRSGANLNGKAKKRYAEITTELSQLSLQFGDNVLVETNNYSLHINDKNDLAGLPETAIEASEQLAKSNKKDGWMFNLQFPSYFPFIQYANNRKLREEIFKAFGSRANKDNDNNNTEVIKKFVNLRLEKAKLLGYKTHAEYVLAERMAENPETVYDFLGELHQASQQAAKDDFKEVENLARKQGFKENIERWDLAYFNEKLKTEKFGFKEEEVKPYFQLEKVTEGIFDLIKKLYGLSFKENKEIQVYHEDVTAYEVFDSEGSFLSILYMDFFPRESKRGGAWSGSYREQSNVDDKEVRPIITIVCNFTKPTESKPSLITFNEFTTFAHEFGHALHGMLANTVYPGLSGTNVYWDFVELPSQIHENWCFEKEWLDTFVQHYETGKKIPQALLQKVINARNYHAGYLCERQLGLGMNDMAWHSITMPFDGEITEFESKAMAPYEVLPPVEGNSTSTSFSHIFAGGYSAGYYSYKWAEVLDADAFSLFKEKGIFDAETAKSFRKNILEKGGTEHPMELYKKFRGQEPTVDALLIRSGLKK